MDKIKTILSGIAGLEERIADEKGDFYDGQRLAFEDARELIYQQFLELQESKDERIRKWIVNYIRHGVFNEEEYPMALKAIEWLEKQKEQKPTEWSDSVAKEMFIKALERAVEQIKKGCELTDCDKHSWWEDFKAYSGIKPAGWSEDDEAFLKVAIAICNRYSHKDIADWLKSLPERICHPIKSDNWKPSEYTLSLVKKVANGEMLTHMEQMAIGTFYDNLQKL